MGLLRDLQFTGLLRQGRQQTKLLKAQTEMQKAELRTQQAQARAVVPAGWYADPEGTANTLRFWDGARWTAWTHPA